MTKRKIAVSHATLIMDRHGHVLIVYGSIIGSPLVSIRISILYFENEKPKSFPHAPWPFFLISTNPSIFHGVTSITSGNGFLPSNDSGSEILIVNWADAEHLGCHLLLLLLLLLYEPMAVKKSTSSHKKGTVNSDLTIAPP